MRVLSRRERRRLATAGPAHIGTNGWWARLAAFVHHHSLQVATAAAAVMVILTIPVPSLRLGWLDRTLPHLSIEPATEPPAQPSPAPARELTRTTTAR